MIKHITTILLALVLCSAIGLAAQSGVSTMSSFSGKANASFTPKFGSRGAIGLDLRNVKVNVSPFKTTTKGPYFTSTVKAPASISQPARFDLKGSTQYYTPKRTFEKTQVNFVSGVRDVAGSQKTPPAGAEVCCDSHTLKYYTAYQKSKCVPQLLDTAGFIKACKGVRGVFLMAPNCQSGQVVCTVPKKFAQ